MSGGDIKRDPFLSLIMAFPNFPLKRRLTLRPGFVSFPGAAASNKNKKPVNMRPEITILIAHLDSVVNMRPATGFTKAMAVKKKEAPISHHTDAPPKLTNCRRFFLASFPEHRLVFFMAIETSEGVRLFCLTEAE